MKQDESELYVRSPNGLLLVLKEETEAVLLPPPVDPISILEGMSPGDEPQTMGPFLYNRPVDMEDQSSSRTRSQQIEALENQAAFDGLAARQARGAK